MIKTTTVQIFWMVKTTTIQVFLTVVFWQIFRIVVEFHSHFFINTILNFGQEWACLEKFFSGAPEAFLLRNHRYNHYQKEFLDLLKDKGKKLNIELFNHNYNYDTKAVTK